MVPSVPCIYSIYLILRWVFSPPFIMSKTKPHLRIECHKWELWEMSRNPSWGRNTNMKQQLCSLPRFPLPPLLSFAGREPCRERSLHVTAAVGSTLPYATASSCAGSLVQYLADFSFPATSLVSLQKKEGEMEQGKEGETFRVLSWASSTAASGSMEHKWVWGSTCA